MNKKSNEKWLSKLRLCNLSALKHLSRCQKDNSFILVKGKIGDIHKFPNKNRPKCGTASICCTFKLYDKGHYINCIVDDTFGIYGRIWKYIVKKNIVYVCGLLGPEDPPLTITVFDIMKVFEMTR